MILGCGAEELPTAEDLGVEDVPDAGDVQIEPVMDEIEEAVNDALDEQKEEDSLDPMDRIENAIREKLR